MPLSISVTDRLKYQHESISELIEDFSEADLKERINPEKWSVFENIAHLAAYQPTFIHRLGLMLDGKKPKFERYVADNDPVFQAILLPKTDHIRRIKVTCLRCKGPNIYSAIRT